MTHYVDSIEKRTLENGHFRKVLFTATHAQLVVMCLQPGEEIGSEVHRKVDQFFRVEQGQATSPLKSRGHYVPSGRRAPSWRADRVFRRAGLVASMKSTSTSTKRSGASQCG